jgi:hypothetical protein
LSPRTARQRSFFVAGLAEPGSSSLIELVLLLVLGIKAEITIKSTITSTIDETTVPVM